MVITTIGGLSNGFQIYEFPLQKNRGEEVLFLKVLGIDRIVALREIVPKSLSVLQKKFLMLL